MTYSLWGDLKTGLFSAMTVGIMIPRFANGELMFPDCPDLIGTIEAKNMEEACREYDRKYEEQIEDYYGR